MSRASRSSPSRRSPSALLRGSRASPRSRWLAAALALVVGLLGPLSQGSAAAPPRGASPTGGGGSFLVGRSGLLVHNTSGCDVPLYARGRDPRAPLRVSAADFQLTAKAVRRHVERLNRGGVRSAGQRYLDAVAAGEYGLAGTIAHGRMFKRLRSRPLLTTGGQDIYINRQPIEPARGMLPGRGRIHRLPDIQYGRPRSPEYRVWDYKAVSRYPYRDPTGQFRDIEEWTGVAPRALYYGW